MIDNILNRYSTAIFPLCNTDFALIQNIPNEVIQKFHGQNREHLVCKQPRYESFSPHL